ncbi:MAG TPA: tyrosine-type recombinase/integrase [Acidobacteriaceae bacterium]|jgi:integrase|nr:tyrosine-type recombinase/integrase [Acidobacteriaceae bacterium]
MSIFKRGGKWWYEFSFQGQRIRESAHTASKTAAVSIERVRRRRLELSAGGVRQQKPLLFSVAAKQWLADSAHWSESTREIYKAKMGHVTPVFGKLLLSDITPEDVAGYQRQRQKHGASPRQINMECAVLRMVLRKHRLWHLLAPDFRPMREREEVGKALIPDEIARLLAAARRSRSQSLYPALVLLLNTGLRSSELRTMQWKQVDLIDGEIVVGRSKTRGGEGRMVPLNQQALAAIRDWRSGFKNPLPDHYVFCSERYGLDGEEGYKSGAVVVWNRDSARAMGSWKVAWGACRKAAGIDCRLHDLRHTFVSRLAEGQTSDQTIMALAGHMSRKMMERYSHVRNEAKRLAVERLSVGIIQHDSPQNPPQSKTSESVRTM